MTLRLKAATLFTTLSLPGVCFAHPAPREEMPDKGPGYLGIEYTQSSDDQYPVIQGISEKSPALRSGLQRGDAIVAINGRTLKDPLDFVERIRACRPGSMVPIVLLRGGENIKLNIRIGYRAENAVDAKPDVMVRSSRVLFAGEVERQTGVRENLEE